MKSEALQYLESHLAIGHINIQEFSALHGLLALFNRLAKLLKRTYAGDIDWHTGTRLIAEEAADARKCLYKFHCLYSHIVSDLRDAPNHEGPPFDPSECHDEIRVTIIRQNYSNEMKTLPGTKELFDRISAHYDDNIYHPFLETHRRNPDHRIWELNSDLTAVYIAMTELYCLISPIADQAGQLAQKVDNYQRACDKYDEGLALKRSNDPSSISFHASSSFIIHESVPSHPYRAGRSFSAVEDVVNRRPAAGRAKQTAQGAEKPLAFPLQAAPVGRRVENIVPRVFTGSFVELEESMRKLQIPKTEASPTTQAMMRDPNVVMESVMTPVSCATPGSSSNTSPGLRRREALIEHDVEFQDRMINGDLIRSRRPVDCEVAGATRELTNEDTSINDETLTRWLNERPAT